MRREAAEISCSHPLPVSPEEWRERAARLRTNETAVCADSCMTLLRLPVTRISPLPGILLASMKRMSPPEGVHARPVTTPGWLRTSATSGT